MRVKISPTTPFGSDSRLSSKIKISVPMPLPTLPLCWRHSLPSIIVSPLASVAAQSSSTRSPPSFSINPSFAQLGQGAAKCHRTRTESKFLCCQSGSRSMRCIMVGTKLSTVGRYASMRSRQRAALKRSLSSTRPPRMSMFKENQKGPLW